MGLLISELMSGVATPPGGTSDGLRPSETAGLASPGAEEFASALAAMVLQLRRNASGESATAQRQDVAAGAEGVGGLATLTLGPTLQAITPASDLPDAASLQAFARSQGLNEQAVQWLLGQPGQGALPAVPGQGALSALPGQGALSALPGQGALSALPGQGALSALPGQGALSALPGQGALSALPGQGALSALPGQGALSALPALPVLPGLQAATDLGSVERLFDPLAATCSALQVAPEGELATALPTDWERLQLLAEEAMALLRAVLVQQQPTIAPPSAQGAVADASVTLVAALTATRRPALSAEAPGLQGITLPTPLPATTTSPDKQVLVAALSATRMPALSAEAPGLQGITVPTPLPATAALPDRQVLVAALEAARTLSTLAQTGAAGGKLPASAAPIAPLVPIAPTDATLVPAAQADVKQALQQLIAALSRKLPDGAEISALAGSPSPAQRAPESPQPLGHQAMVFVRAVQQLQRGAATVAPGVPPGFVPGTHFVARPAAMQVPLELELDLTEAWIGDSAADGVDASLHGGRSADLDEPAAPSGAARTHAASEHAPAARVLAQWQQARLLTATQLPSVANDPAAPLADVAVAEAALPTSSQAGMPPVTTAEDLMRSRPSSSTVQAASAGSDTGGYKPQDPDRGRQLADKMGEAVGQRMLQALERGDWTVKLALKPANLGHIEVNMRMHSAGLDAQFTASQAQTRDLLADGLQRLRDTLMQMGMDVAQLNVGGDRSHKRGGDSTPRQTTTAKPVAGVGKSGETDAKNQLSVARPRSSDNGWDVMV